eukprot:4865232-Ditylum_brightwellii.AAC.1
MKHFVWTNSGESFEFYHHSDNYMKGGEGQGKTFSPTNWLFQSSTLLNSLDEQYTELYLTSFDEKYVSERVTEGCVDDTDTVTADQYTQKTDTPKIIMDCMTAITQT